ncbi:zinc-binding dehydrogenase [Streptomyces sp. NPDC001833]|uniref:quinone oxidoreductase family protein n=1 Tax=Streptomyces sp. NPDC001833 TaxID=3154658 RepID=UPI00331B1C77
MRAIIAQPSGPQVTDIPQPSPGDQEVLVRVRAAALNRIDLVMSRGAAHGEAGGAGLPFGVEWAGEIVEVGSAVDRWSVGDRVMGAGPQAFAEYKAAHAFTLYPVPDGLSFEQAATLPVGLQTMHDAIATKGLLEPGQSVLVQGASSGMGLMGMQVAKALGAGLVIGTSTSAERRSRLKEFGADLVVDSRAEDWVDQVARATDGAGVDLLVDLVAGPLVSDGMRATRVGGRMVNIGRVGGESGEVDFDLHSMRQITYIGVTFRTRTPLEIVQVIGRASAALKPALDEGLIQVPVDTVYDLSDSAAAFERMAQNKHFGKIIIAFG